MPLVLRRGAEAFGVEIETPLVQAQPPDRRIEAALLAARRGKEKVGMADMDEAAERVMAGPERKSRVMSESEKRNTAYHEAGHALIAELIPELDPVHKVSIIPRGLSMGYTMQLPLEDKFSMEKKEMLNRFYKS